MNVQVIGDEVWADGYRVAILTRDVPQSYAREFVDSLHDGFRELPCPVCPGKMKVVHTDDCPHKGPPPPSPVEKIKPLVRGGLVRFSDIQKAFK